MEQQFEMKIFSIERDIYHLYKASHNKLRSRATVSLFHKFDVTDSRR